MCRTVGCRICQTVEFLSDPVRVMSGPYHAPALSDCRTVGLLSDRCRTAVGPLCRTAVGLLLDCCRTAAVGLVLLVCLLAVACRLAVDQMLAGRSAHVGHTYLTLGNKNVRSRTSAALGAVREGAVHRLLDTRTQATRVRAPVKVRPQNSHVVKLERCAKLTDLSDLRRADRGGQRDGATAAFRIDYMLLNA